VAELGDAYPSAINNGLVEIEIKAAVPQATVWCGTPPHVDDRLAMEIITNDIAEKGKYKRTKAESDVLHRLPISRFGWYSLVGLLGEYIG
jgi:hypothetical protein